jgi:predicted phosphodiesterase
MRIALLSDIHGNDIALDAVLADIEAQGGVDAYWVLGDLVAIGHAPVKVLERLSGLPNALFTRGNTDRYVCTGARPRPTLDEVKARPELLPTLLEVEGCFSWTQGAVTVSGWLNWLADLPLELNETLPDGTSILGVHAAPQTDDGPGIPPTMPESKIQELLSECEADLIFVGHTHHPFDLRINHQRLINLGSVSNPPGPDLRASYVLLSADQQGYEVEHRRVGYDHQAVIEILRRIQHPAARFIIRHLRGEVV